MKLTEAEILSFINEKLDDECGSAKDITVIKQDHGYEIVMEADANPFIAEGSERVIEYDSINVPTTDANEETLSIMIYESDEGIIIGSVAKDSRGYAGIGDCPVDWQINLWMAEKENADWVSQCCREEMDRRLCDETVELMARCERMIENVSNMSSEIRQTLLSINEKIMRRIV